MENTNNLKLTFGKYSLKKYTIIDVINDINYKNWLISQSWFKKLYRESYDFIINYKEPNIIKNISKTTGIILCDDILELIGNYFKEIKNKPVDRIKHGYICKRCKITQWYYCSIYGQDDGWSDSCGDCNIKDQEISRKNHIKFLKDNKCKCGKYKKSGFAMCYNCNLSASPVIRARAYKHDFICSGYKS